MPRISKYIVGVAQSGAPVFSPEFQAMAYRVAQECPRYTNEQIAFALELRLDINETIQMIHFEEEDGYVEHLQEVADMMFGKISKVA